ncbi:hypothetical protein FNU76_16990 [Chitinimonas arctica]|uniref:Uncharacterized protein n=1 Tax=Chitinimonas arctica TaxID=2594795 RepID=A0A516SID0_9NEIS|nr:hypothetical protein [Chitinimonas arctica]QDQ27904.1 hypothetical protein FNU76_16990 [Chitinimonas arctica]
MEASISYGISVNGSAFEACNASTLIGAKRAATARYQAAPNGTIITIVKVVHKAEEVFKHYSIKLVGESRWCAYKEWKALGRELPQGI